MTTNLKFRGIWLLAFLNKPIYCLIMWNLYRNNPGISEVPAVMVIVLIALAAISVLFGVLKVLTTFKDIPALSRIPFFRKHSTPEQPWSLSSYVNGLGIIEAPAVYGLVIFVWSGNMYYFLGMLSVSLLAWAFSFPRLKEDKAEGDGPEIS